MLRLLTEATVAQGVKDKTDKQPILCLTSTENVFNSTKIYNQKMAFLQDCRRRGGIEIESGKKHCF